MSSYWAGYSGTAIVLSPEELEMFLKNYNEINNDTIEMDDEDFMVNLNEMRFVSADGNKDHAFDITLISDDECDGMRFVPFLQKDGLPNKYKTAGTDANGCPIFTRHMVEELWRTGTRYAIFSRYSMDGPWAFPLHYTCYEDIEKEFKTSLDKYLPNDFSWGTRIGHFSYAAYA